jgi:replicative DNA helicase
VYLSELNLATPSSAHIEHYARMVLEQAVRRRYISAAQQQAELAQLNLRYSNAAYFQTAAATWAGAYATQAASAFTILQALCQNQGASSGGSSGSSSSSSTSQMQMVPAAPGSGY